MVRGAATRLGERVHSGTRCCNRKDSFKGDVQIGCQVGQELTDIIRLQLAGMALTVVDDEAPYPVNVRFLGPGAQMSNAAGVPYMSPSIRCTTSMPTNRSQSTRHEGREGVEAPVL